MHVSEFERELSRQRFAGLALPLLSIVFAFNAAAAGHELKPMAIRGDRADELAQPTATAHFGCETRAFAVKTLRFACYGPAAIRSAYGVSDLIASGLDGTGQTIVIIDAFSSPTITSDLQTFDALFGLPDPDFQIVQMPGVPTFDPTNANQVGWADEMSLDVTWSHAMAPGARIVLIEGASDNDLDLIAAQEYAIEHYPGAAISESYGAPEFAYTSDPSGAGVALLKQEEASYARARRHHHAVFVSAGDNGTLGFDYQGNPAPSVSYPASSPNVTAVGGTNLFFGSPLAADPNGTYQFEWVWNDGIGVTGGGVSGFFAQPTYQNSLPASVVANLGGYRGLPDVAYNAGVEGGVLVHLGFLGKASGFYIFGGTSAGAPQWAALAAIMSQMRGDPVGNINARLYALGASGGLSSTMHDVTAGMNGLSFRGFPATPGWDLTTGWGTPSAGLLRALAGSAD